MTTASPSAASERTIGQTDEFELIELIRPKIDAPSRILVGSGDDSAVVSVAEKLVVSTDALVAGVHFRLEWSTPQQIGRKLIAVAATDIEAMGATPDTAVVALCLPAEMPLKWLTEFAAGVHEETQRIGVHIVGGDLTRSPNVVATVTIWGTITGEPILRSGARPGDVIATRGRLGWAAAGLGALARGFRSPRAVVAAQLCPEPPYGAGLEARSAGATAMIDISDGLLADLAHIAEASRCTLNIDPDTIPVAEPIAAVAAASNKSPLQFVLGGGEDGALAATFPAGSVPEGWLEIGKVSAGEPQVLVAGKVFGGDTGWVHFGD